MESMGSKKPRQRRSFTPEFKAEIVELCQRADRSVGQVAGDFDLTETARVHAQLVRRGHRHGRKRVARIMRASGLRGRAAKRWKKTTIADRPRGVTMAGGAIRAAKARMNFAQSADPGEQRG